MGELGELNVKIGADTKEFNKKMKDASASMTKAGTVMMGVGTAIVGSLLAITHRAAKAGDELHKMSLRTGVGTEALSELKYAADLSGTSIDTIENSFRRMQDTLSKASEGLTGAEDALGRVNLKVDELKGMSPDEQFMKIMEAVDQIKDPTERAASVMGIFGTRMGTELLPMLENGAEGLHNMREAAHEFGVIIDEEAAAKSAEFNDRMHDMKQSFEDIQMTIGTALMPAFTEFIEESLTPTIRKVGGWVSENEDLVLSLLKVGGVLAAGGAIMVGLGQIARAITAINAAMAIMLALTGPKGWAMLAAGAGIAAGAIAGFKHLMPDEEIPFPEPGQTAGQPGFFAEGGIFTQPTLGVIGEAGPEAVVPLPASLGNVTVNVEGSVLTERQLIDTIHEGLLRKKSSRGNLGL